jgi:hypothetical protein
LRWGLLTGMIVGESGGWVLVTGLRTRRQSGGAPALGTRRAVVRTGADRPVAAVEGNNHLVGLSPVEWKLRQCTRTNNIPGGG